MLPEDELSRLRCSIDAIDSQLLAMLGERAALVRQIAACKHAMARPVYDPERERRVIARLIAEAPRSVDEQFVQRVFERIIDESRRLEQAYAKG